MSSNTWLPKINIMFKIGDRITRKQTQSSYKHGHYKNEVSAPIQKNRVFTVLDVEYCKKCGVQSVHIGLKIPYALPVRARCGHCGDIQNLANSKWFLMSTEFEKVIYDNISLELAASFRETIEKPDISKINTEKISK